jgi:CheY-like chemotaxis protein
VLPDPLFKYSRISLRGIRAAAPPGDEFHEWKALVEALPIPETSIASGMVSNPHRILLVDDDFDEQLLSSRALRKVLSTGSTLNLANGGDEAIAYLIGEGKFGDRQHYPFPTVVITDLNMPQGDGFELLEFLKANPAWRVVPRIVFSSDNHPDNIRTAFQLGASAYHLKPAAFREIESQIAQIIAYWSTSQVPHSDASGRLERTSKSHLRGDRFPQTIGGVRMTRPRRSG